MIMDSAMNIVQIALYVFFGIMALSGLYIMITKKVIMSYWTLGRGKYTEESKKDFAPMGGLGTFISFMGLLVVQYSGGFAASNDANMPLFLGAMVVAIIGIIIFYVARRKLVKVN